MLSAGFLEAASTCKIEAFNGKGGSYLGIKMDNQRIVLSKFAELTSSRSCKVAPKTTCKTETRIANDVPYIGIKMNDQIIYYLLNTTSNQGLILSQFSELTASGACRTAPQTTCKVESWVANVPYIGIKINDLFVYYMQNTATNRGLVLSKFAEWNSADVCDSATDE